MKKIFKNNWHIFLLLTLVLVISIFSWISYANDVGHKLKVSLQNYNSSNINNSSTSMFLDNPTNISITNIIDSMTTAFDSMWNIYKQGLFCKYDSLLTYYISGEIKSSQVILGKDNWLFYSTTHDGNSLADYEGTNIYKDQDLANIFKSVLPVQESLNAKDIKFVILVAPNKEIVYSRYMPLSYVHSTPSRTDKLVKYLLDNGINIVYPKTHLINESNNHDVYYRYDTHWNQLGAYIGVEKALSAMGVTIPDITSREILSSNLTDKYHYGGNDDLARMVGLTSVFSDDTEYEINGTIPINWDLYELEQSNNQLSYFHNRNANKNSTLLLIGDSFRLSMAQSLIEQFSDLYIIHRDGYNASMIDDISPNYIIGEYVERYSDEIRNISFITD